MDSLPDNYVYRDWLPLVGERYARRISQIHRLQIIGMWQSWAVLVLLVGGSFALRGHVSGGLIAVLDGVLVVAALSTIEYATMRLVFLQHELTRALKANGIPLRPLHGVNLRGPGFFERWCAHENLNPEQVAAIAESTSLTPRPNSAP